MENHPTECPKSAGRNAQNTTHQPLPDPSSRQETKESASEPQQAPRHLATVRSLPYSGRFAERGMATAEYAIATLAAVGFAGLFVVILRSDEVRGFLLGLIRNALSLG
ncbi:DUF4244 domain-containing protein [Acaricomes phytoseiuli]|uniref:DUF4244 domain-containing protein n=1 Tax=Acaricomes phytoseiuli TaxID=291968 RepID=UPI0005B822FB|nr:DUF4244 domain-containing protein [Acaricomes phytoseiuli]